MFNYVLEVEPNMVVISIAAEYEFPAFLICRVINKFKNPFEFLKQSTKYHCNEIQNFHYLTLSATSSFEAD